MDAHFRFRSIFEVSIHAEFILGDLHQSVAFLG